MVDKKPLSDSCSRVDLNSSEEAGDMGHQSRQDGNMPIPEGMLHAMELASIETGIDKNNLPGISGCRVMLKSSPYVPSNTLQKSHFKLRPSWTKATE